ALSPFGRPLYLDFEGERLILSDHPRGKALFLFGPQRESPSIHAEIDFPALWALIGAGIQKDYKTEKASRAKLKDVRLPKQEEMFWDAFFALAGALGRMTLEVDASKDPLRASLDLPLPSAPSAKTTEPASLDLL